MAYQEMYHFIDNMPEAEFTEKIKKIAHTGEFSAIVSGFGVKRDVETLRASMLAAGVHPEWYDDEISRRLLCFRITNRIAGKKPE